MNLSDTFYIALCMTVLILGVVYWFWTQNQYMQRKMNLLENIVYEMKSTMGTGPPGGFEPVGHGASASTATEDGIPPAYHPAPSSVLGDDEDLLHEELHSEVMAAAEEDDGIPAVVNSMPDDDDDEDGINAESLNDDLQPGGVGSGDVKEMSSEPKGSNVLDSLTLKQLKTLASQHNISGAAGMRKQELIQALRAKIPAGSTF
jgi:hypothetical protein